ncbi:MAG: AgmX/PglI C-terminal domain-containing protein [Myxococcales bacterium]|nr:AgmX/PglI C-terminal domain-containing protein [Myxococcales bacterium]
MSDSQSNLKYAVLGLLLLGAGIGLFFLTQEEPKAPPPPTNVDSKRSTALAQPELEIPDPVRDAGTPDAGPVKKKIVYVRDKWDCSGSVAPAAALAVVRSNNQQVRTCYERRLKVNHQLQGTVRVTLRIDRTGNVSATQTGGSLKDPEVLSCIRRAAGSWKFPVPEGGACAIVQAPFNLSPKN